MSLKYNHQTLLIFISAFILLPSMPGVDAYYYGKNSICDDRGPLCIGFGVVGAIIAFFSIIAIIGRCISSESEQTNSNAVARNSINTTSANVNRATLNTNTNNQINRTTNSDHHVVNMTGSSDIELTQQSLENGDNQPPPPYIRDTNLPKYNNT